MGEGARADQDGERGRAFHIEEFKSLREEIAGHLKESRDLERNVVLACFAIWVWVLGKGDWELWPALLLPPIAAGLGAWRSQALSWSMLETGRYIRGLESRYGSAPPLGWEHFFRGEDEKNPLQHRLGKTAVVFWGSLIVGSVLVSLLVGVVIHGRQSSAASPCTCCQHTMSTLHALDR